MSAQVISFHAAKARHIAIAKAARVREIAIKLDLHPWWGIAAWVVAVALLIIWHESEDIR